MASPKTWPDYRTVWRWHFYAGLFCIPFVLTLSVTGTIYLFKPQIEAWRDRPFAKLSGVGEPLPLHQQIGAAVASVDHGVFQQCQLTPQGSGEEFTSATQVLVQQGDRVHRVYVHPSTAEILASIDDQDSLVSLSKRIHGTLLLGERGSYLVELAASWTVVMLITGLALWWPRGNARFAGVIYPRIRSTGKVFWRDLHGVTGVWISGLALLLIVTGLPWATFWGDYFKTLRSVTGTAVVRQDWDGGHQHSEHQHVESAENPEPKAKPSASFGPLRGPAPSPDSYRIEEIDAVRAIALQSRLAPPTLLRPPTDGSSVWTIVSDTGNRPRRETITFDAQRSEIVGRTNFADRHWVDRAVGIGIALHEGQLFGWINQLLAVVATGGLMLLSFSGLVLWWRRRDPGLFRSPQPNRSAALSWSSVRSVTVLVGIAALAIFLPLFAFSLVAVLAAEKMVAAVTCPASTIRADRS